MTEEYRDAAAQKFSGEIDDVEVTVQTEIDASFDAGNVDSFQATITYGGPVNTEYTARFTETDPNTNEFTAEIEVVEGGGGGGTQLCIESQEIHTASGSGTFTPMVLRASIPQALQDEPDFADQAGKCIMFEGRGVPNDSDTWWNLAEYAFSETYLFSVQTGLGTMPGR